MTLVHEGSGSAVSNSVSVACETIRCHREALAESDLGRTGAFFSNMTNANAETVAIAGLLRDLLGLKYDSLLMRNDTLLTEDINFAIIQLCTG